MRILIISSGVPFPPANGGLLRTFHLARALSVDHEITLACFSFGDEKTPVPFTCRLLEVPWKNPALYDQMVSTDESVADRATQILKQEKPEPWFASFYDLPEMEALIHRESRQTDLVIFEGSDMARFVDVIPEEITKVYDFMDVHSAMFKRDASRLKPGSYERQDADFEAQRTLQFEKSIASRSALKLVCSGLEADRAKELFGYSHYVVFPNGVDTEFHQPAKSEIEPESILFIGTLNYGPNVEAVRYFTRDIFPLIRKKKPDAKFHIVGSRAIPAVKKLGKEPGVVFHGRVEDIRPYYHRAILSVVPILSGGGTRLKILEGAGQGKAMVSTTIGAEGLCMNHGKELLIADTPQDFANAVLNLMENEALRGRLGKQARKASLQYDWRKIENEIRSVFKTNIFANPAQSNLYPPASQPLVSIIINNYNYGQFLGQAIDSALQQTYPNIELIVVDDGSTDHSREIISRYKMRVQTVLKENGGQGSAFNAGFAACAGEIVLFLDADDLLFSNTAAETVNAMNKTSSIKVHWPLEMIEANGDPLGKRLPSDSLLDGNYFESTLKNGPCYDIRNVSPTSGNAWKRTFLEKVLPMPEKKYRTGADTFLHTLIPVYGSMTAIKEPLGKYRAHGQNAYYKRKLDDQKAMQVLERIAANCQTLERHLTDFGYQPDLEVWKQTNWNYVWLKRLCRAKDDLRGLIKPGESFVLVDDAEWGGALIEGCRAIPFIERDGKYWGPPSDDETAIREIERLQTQGADYLVFWWTSFWWLETYPKFFEYLKTKFNSVLSNDRLVIYNLQQSAQLTEERRQPA